jgi:protein-disulfide isomerase
MALKVAVNEKDHIQGNPNASIELVEYGDYECPYCGEAFYEIKKIQKELGDDLKFVFRNFPLTNIHQNAFAAAVSSEVAADFDKFWQMHDILFENQNALDDEDLVSYAKRIGLDEKVFVAKFSDSKYEEKIEEDMESGLRSGVNGTPSFYINGKKYDGDYTANAIVEYIRSL